MKLISSHRALTAAKVDFKHLSEEEVNRLTECFEHFFDASPERRGRHWLVYLTLRFTGARLGEVLRVDDIADVDYRRGEIRMQTLKRTRRMFRTVPVPLQLTSEIARVVAALPILRGTALRVDPSNFRKRFLGVCQTAGICRELAHPHVLRHTRAFELLRAGVRISTVQDLLGHASILTTAIYLKASGVEVRQELKDRGIL